MLNDRDGLAVYRLLEFPNESAESWPIADGARGEDLISSLRFLRDPRRSTEAAKKIAA